MRISEAMSQLRNLKEEHGDIELALALIDDKTIEFDFEIHFEAAGMLYETADGKSTETKPICAIVFDDEVIMPPKVYPKRHLKIV